MSLTSEDRRRVVAAIAAAELSGRMEIRCVEILPPRLRDIALPAGLAAVLLPAALVAAGWRPTEPWRTGGWTVIDPHPVEALLLYIAVQVGLLVAFLLLGLAPWSSLAPRSWRRAWVRRAANRQFAALGMTHTLRRTAVLIAVCSDCSEAVVVVDAGLQGLSEADLRQDVELGISEAMRRRATGAGLVSAIERLAYHAAKIFPAVDDANELPDHFPPAPRSR